MVTTRSSMAKTKTLGTRKRSKGLPGQTTTLATRTKLDNTIKRFDQELKLCKTFIVKNLKYHETVESQVRRLITSRECTFRLIEEWRDHLGKQLVQLYEYYLLRDTAELELYDLEAEPLYNRARIAHLQEVIADLSTKIELILVDEAEIERNVRRIKTTFADVARFLQTYKADHETMHLRLLQKFAFIVRSRHRAITQRKGLGTTKVGRKIFKKTA